MVSQAFSHFSIMVVHAEKIFLYISHFVSSFSTPFCSSLHASSFHCFTPVSLFFAHVLPFHLDFPSCYFYHVLFISGPHFKIGLLALCKWFFFSLSSFCYGNTLKCHLLRCRIFYEICLGQLQGMWWLNWFSIVGGYVERKRWERTWQWMCKMEG